jgi:hypothetical protein
MTMPKSIFLPANNNILDAESGLGVSEINIRILRIELCSDRQQDSLAEKRVLDVRDGLIINKKLIPGLQNILLIHEKRIFGVDDPDYFYK